MHHCLRACFLVIGFGCTLSAHAQEDAGIYFGASVGEAKNEVDEFKGSDTAFKLTGGYAFNKYFSVELAYLDAGKQADTIDQLRIQTESSGVIASALVSLPVGDAFSLFGKLGYAFYDSDTTMRLGDQVARASESENDLAYGAGLEVAITRGLRLRAEYEAVNVSEGNFDIVSAGVTYKF